MSAIILSVNGNKHPVPLSCPVPLSPRSYLAWAGFTDEGTPTIMDSAGIVRMMHFKYGYNWTVILNTKNHVSNNEQILKKNWEQKWELISCLFLDIYIWLLPKSMHTRASKKT